MNLFRPLLSSALGLVLLGTAAVAHAEPSALDRIVAIVNDGVILQSELDRAIKLTENQLRDRGISPPPAGALQSQVLERLVTTRLQTQRANEAGIKIDDRELNEVLSSVAAQNKLTLEQFVGALAREGLDYDAVREQIRDEVLVQRVRQKEVGSRVVVTEQDVDLALSNASSEDNTEYRLSHILVAVPDGATAEVRAKARAKAQDLLKQVRDGGDFAQIAISSSDGQQALQGGDLDWRKGNNLPTAFASVAPKLHLGESSNLIETGGGYNIIKLVDKRETGERTTVNETRAQHILVSPNALRDEAASLAQIRDLHDRILKGEDMSALAKKYSDDPGSKNGGGDLGWQPPGVFASEFQAAIDALKPGELSAPFRTQFGWHIARVTERRTRDTTEEARRGRVRQAIGQRKEADEYDAWARRLRDEAYVEYRLNAGNKPAG